MCDFVLIGAVTNRVSLAEALESAGADFDTELIPAPEARQRFRADEEVVCVTLHGCSCALVEGIGSSKRRHAEAHMAGPGYRFRRALAEAVLRFREVRLLTYSSAPTLAKPASLPCRQTTLGEFLRFGLQPNDGLVSIVAR